jgi:hypothetical protein
MESTQMQQQPEAPEIVDFVGGLMCMSCYFGMIVLVIVGMWTTFTKAGKPGWASIIPIYNLIVLIEVAGQPIWLLILFFIPIANIVAAVLVAIGVAKNFGKGGGFAIGLVFLPFIFYPILGFSNARYCPKVIPPYRDD